MKRLIVHADDLGADRARNEGIIECIEKGVVTATSIIANGPAFGDCLSRIADLCALGLSFGIHLNVTEGRPLTPGLRVIAGKDGSFYGKREGHRRLMTVGDEELEDEIKREFTAQIQALLDAGIRIDHLNGHQHVHVFPAAVDAAIDAAIGFGIPWIRIPEEPPPSGFTDRGHAEPEEEAECFCSLAAALRSKIQGTELKTTDHFRGLYLKGRLSLETLEKTLQDLPPGLTELMVHPGRAQDGLARGPFSAFSNEDREKELMVLTSGRFQRMLEEYHLKPTPFPEACC